jgi:hypothetical protein
MRPSSNAYTGHRRERAASPLSQARSCSWQIAGDPPSQSVAVGRVPGPGVSRVRLRSGPSVRRARARPLHSCGGVQAYALLRVRPMSAGLLRDRALDLVDALSHQHDAAWATERAMRSMLERSGKRPGERSVSRVLRRAARDGTIRRVRVPPGGRLPNGQYTRHGTTLNVRISRQERRAEARRRAKERRRVERVAHRGVPSPAARAPKGEEQITLAAWLADGNTVSEDVREMLAIASTPKASRGPPPD